MAVGFNARLMFRLAVRFVFPADSTARRMHARPDLLLGDFRRIFGLGIASKEPPRRPASFIVARRPLLVQIVEVLHLYHNDLQVQDLS